MTLTPRTEQLRRPWAVWWTLCVAIFFATAPTLSHAVSFARYGGSGGIEICTAQGPKTVAPDSDHSTDASSTGQESASPVNHCPFCLHQADRLAPPPTAMRNPHGVQGGPQELPVWQALFYADNTAFWAPPRGPPSETAS
jgi:Protein of unknown function (DUF2946)